MAQPGTGQPGAGSGSALVGGVGEVKKEYEPIAPPPDSAPKSPHPSKRPRKAINCQPCRASKLKCDRARPCSSCVLRGTASQCYSDGRADRDSRSHRSDIDLDPQAEIQKMRHSLALLESFILRSDGAPLVTSTPSSTGDSLPDHHHRTDPEESSMHVHANTAKLETQTDAGLYAGPTSSAIHLVQHETSPVPSDEGLSFLETLSLIDDREDRDLLEQLPEYPIVDQALQFFTDQCCIMNPYILKSTLLNSWDNFKSGVARTRVTLSLVFGCIAIAIQFLPLAHELLLYLRRESTASVAELSDWYYEQCCTSLVRHENDTTMPSLELVEAQLIKMLYLGISKSQAEEIWRLRGCTTSNALALGLHRDPSTWNMPHALAERRRWAFFNVLRVERWHAFMLGRPPAFNNNHFDTLLPSSIDPYVGEQSKARLHLPHLQLFKLGILYGDLMTDMVSVKPVPHSSIMAHQRALDSWTESFPEELKFDVANLASCFSSSDVSLASAAVQSLCLKLAGLHTQLAMHRPYANAHDPKERNESLELAMSAANEIISLTTICRPNYLSNPALTVPGHIHWGVLHHFAAIMFLIFQVISRPEQEEQVRSSIVQGVTDMEALRGIPAADKAITILHALKPLYENMDRPSNLSENRKAHILHMARHLPFPFLDSPGQRAQRGHSSQSTPSPVAHQIGLATKPSGLRNLMFPHHIASRPDHPASVASSQPTLGDPPLQLYNGPMLPTQTNTAGDEPFWSSAVGIETGDWSRFIHDMVPKQMPQI